MFFVSSFAVPSGDGLEKEWRAEWEQHCFCPWVRGWLSQVTTRRRLWEGVRDSDSVKAQPSEIVTSSSAPRRGTRNSECRKAVSCGEGRVAPLTGDPGK